MEIMYHLISILELGAFIIAFLGLFPLAKEWGINIWLLILPYLIFATTWIYRLEIFSENGLLHFMTTNDIIRL